MSIRRVDDRSLYHGSALPAVATGPAGTAHGPAVDLKPRAGAATGGYLVIDQPQADAIMDELEREQAINPITQERPELRASIFRVEARTPKPNGDPRYSYWDPAELWRWLQQPNRQGRMPDTNEPAWFEDWWALYYTYGAPAVPSWAYSLEKRSPDTQPSASVRGAAPGLPPAQRRNAVRDRSVDRPSLTNDEAGSLWERIHGGGGDGGGQGPQAAPGSDALAAWRDATANNITPSDGRMQAFSNRNPERAAARAAAVAQASSEGISRRSRTRPTNDDAVDDLPPPSPMGRTPTLSEDGAAWWRGEISREEAEARAREANARARARARAREESERLEGEEAYHLAEAERYRNAPPASDFGSSNAEMEAYHRNQAAHAAARRAGGL